MRMTQSPKFWATVRREFQTEGGSRQTDTFEIEFKRVSQEEAREFSARFVENASGNQVDTFTDWIMEVATNWRNVIDADNNDVPFSRESVYRAVNEFGVGNPILTAFIEALPKAKAKN